MDYITHLCILVTIFATLATSLNLVAGEMGMLSMAQAAFYGLGAYTSALLATHAGVPFLIGTMAGAGLALLVAALISLPALRLQDEFFVIATFAFQVILFSLFNNWTSLTNGPLGIPGIPRPNILGWQPTSPLQFLALSALLAAFAYLVVYRLTSSPFGRVLHAIREDEAFAKSLGKNTLYFKVSAFTVSAALAATAGSLYAHYTTFIDPSSFSIMESILVLSMVIVGGAGSLWGPLVGAAVLIGLPEGLRFVGMPAAAAAYLRQIIYGALLVIMMMFRPQGLVGKYRFTK